MTSKDGRRIVLGTPVYMSPEQHMGAEIDARSDQYSFCVALFQALYGRAPFPGKTPRDIFRAKLDNALVPRPDELGRGPSAGKELQGGHEQ